MLLSSILDHLRKDPDRFLGTAEGWTSHRILPYPGQLPEFPLDRILREASEESMWPEITTHPSAVRFHARHPKPWKRDLTLDFIDFPGENVADFLGEGNFGKWSQSIRNLFPDPLDAASVEGMNRLRESLLQNPSQINPEKISRQYAETVVAATKRGRYLTSPASLCSRVFDPGHKVDNEDFAPLFMEGKDAPEEILTTFSTRFDQYHRSQVRPLERLIAEADALILPIDVSWILSGGPALLRDQHALLSAMGALLSRMDTIWNRMASFFGRSFTPVDDAHFPGRLRSVVLCATKIDIFRPSDRSVLEDLIRRIAEPIFRGAGLHGIRVLFTACSAIRSTTDAGDGDESLHGYQGGQPIQIVPPQIPEEWPDRWDPADFRFPRLDPRISRNGLYPPAQINLDRMVRSILES